MDREKPFVIGIVCALITVSFIKNINILFLVNDMRFLILDNRLVDALFDERFLEDVLGSRTFFGVRAEKFIDKLAKVFGVLVWDRRIFSFANIESQVG